MKPHHFKCTLCGGIKTKPGRCPECKRLPEFYSDIKRKLVQSEREARFYRGQLEAISSSERRTRAQRLASSALMFWDAMKTEVENKPCQPRALR